MKNRSVLIIAIATVAVIGGAYYMYNALSPMVDTERISPYVTPPDPDSGSVSLTEQYTASGDTAGEAWSSASEANGAAGTETAAENSGKNRTEASEGTGEAAGTSAVEKAPDFTVYDIDGDAVSLSDFIGKPVVINFWASWCGPCKMEMPEFEEKHKELGGDVHFLMVNMTDGNRETRETAISFIEESGYTFPIYLDTDQDAAYTYGVYSIPSTYFIGADGTAVAMAQGAIDSSVLERGIDMIYSKEN